MRPLLAGIAFFVALASFGMLGMGAWVIYELEEEAEPGKRKISEPDEREERAEDGLILLLGSGVGGLVTTLLVLALRTPTSRAASSARVEELEDRLSRLTWELEAVHRRLTGADAEDSAASLSRFTVPSLVESLDHENVRVRREAAHMLGSMGPAAREAAGAVEATLHRPDEDASVLRAAALALVRVSGRPERAVSPLVRKLTSMDPSVRDWAAVTLGRIGPDAIAAMPHLIALLRDPVVATTAKEALRRIGGDEADRCLRWRRKRTEA